MVIFAEVNFSATIAIASDVAPLNQIKVLAYKDKGEWILEQKYNIGSKKKVETTE